MWIGGTGVADDRADGGNLVAAEEVHKREGVIALTLRRLASELHCLHTLDCERLPERLEAFAAASLLPAAGHDVDRARALWAVGHGMVDLEIAGSLPPDDLDAAWAAAVDSYLDG